MSENTKNDKNGNYLWLSCSIHISKPSLPSKIKGGILGSEMKWLTKSQKKWRNWRLIRRFATNPKWISRLITWKTWKCWRIFHIIWKRNKKDHHVEGLPMNDVSSGYNSPPDKTKSFTSFSELQYSYSVEFSVRAPSVRRSTYSRLTDVILSNV